MECDFQCWLIFFWLLLCTGSDLVEAEKTGIKIVQSPYVVSFKDMIKYFKPGHPFDFTVRTTNVLDFLFCTIKQHRSCLFCADPSEQPRWLAGAQRPSQGEPPGLPLDRLWRIRPGHHQHAQTSATANNHCQYSVFVLHGGFSVLLMAQWAVQYLKECFVVLSGSGWDCTGWSETRAAGQTTGHRQAFLPLQRTTTKLSVYFLGDQQSVSWRPPVPEAQHQYFRADSQREY